MNPIVTVLAIKRITQLITEDEITRVYREGVLRWAGDAPEGSLKERLSYLVDCPACVSVWAAGAVLLLNQHPAGRVLVKVFAGSAATLLIDAVVKTLEDR